MRKRHLVLALLLTLGTITFLDRLCVDAHFFARVQGGEDNTVTILIEECRREALVSTRAVSLERIEAQYFDSVNLFLHPQIYRTEGIFNACTKTEEFRDGASVLIDSVFE